MANAIPLKISNGTAQQLASTDTVFADGIAPRSSTTLSLGADAATTVINMNGVNVTTINVGNATTQVNIPGSMTVTTTAVFNGNIDLGDGGGGTINVGGAGTDVVNLKNNLTVGNNLVGIGSSTTNMLSQLWLAEVTGSGGNAALNLRATGAAVAGAYAIGSQGGFTSFTPSDNSVAGALAGIDTAIGTRTLQTAYDAGSTIVTDATGNAVKVKFANANTDVTALKVSLATPATDFLTAGNGLATFDYSPTSLKFGNVVRFVGANLKEPMLAFNKDAGARTMTIDPTGIQPGGVTTFTFGIEPSPPTTASTAGIDVRVAGSESNPDGVNGGSATVTGGQTGPGSTSGAGGFALVRGGSGVGAGTTGGNAHLRAGPADDGLAAYGSVLIGDQDTLAIAIGNTTDTPAILAYQTFVIQPPVSGTNPNQFAQELDFTGVGLQKTGVYLSEVSPEGVVTAFPGSTCHVRYPVANANDGLWIKGTGAGNTGWAQVSTGTGSGSLQTAYVNGNTISVSAGEGTIAFSNSTDGSDVLSVSRSFAGGGLGIEVSMGAATTGDAVVIDTTAGATGDALRILNSGSGNALHVKDGANDVLLINQNGAFTVTAQNNGTVGSAVSLSAGAGVAAGSVGGALALVTGNGVADATAGGNGGLLSGVTGNGGTTTAGVGGNAGRVTVTTGTGGNASASGGVGGVGGHYILTAGNGGTATDSAAGDGGAMDFNTGAGGAATANGGNGGGAGGFSFTGGNGGAAINAGGGGGGSFAIFTGAGGTVTKGSAGGGGVVNIILGAAGNATASAGTPGTGGDFQLIAGFGGNQTGGGAAAGGQGGGVFITAGQGGTGTGANGGSGGAVTLTGGQGIGNANGGALNLVAGNQDGTGSFGSGGAALFRAGDTTNPAGLGGTTSIQTGLGSAANGFIDIGTDITRSPSGIRSGNTTGFPTWAHKGALTVSGNTGSSEFIVQENGVNRFLVSNAGLATEPLITITPTAQGTNPNQYSPIFFYSDDAGAIGGSQVYAAEVSPEGKITAPPGSICHVRYPVANANDGLWIKNTGTGNTGWSQASTSVPTTPTLQQVYNASSPPSISIGSTALDFFNSTNANHVLNMERTFVGAGNGLNMTMATGTTGNALFAEGQSGNTGTLVVLQKDSGSTGDVLSVTNSNAAGSGINVVLDNVASAGFGIAVGISGSGTAIGINVDYAGSTEGIRVQQLGSGKGLYINNVVNTGLSVQVDQVGGTAFSVDPSENAVKHGTATQDVLTYLYGETRVVPTTIGTNPNQYGKLFNFQGTGLQQNAAYLAEVSPEGVITANPGSTAHVRYPAANANDGLWVKRTGTGNTGWSQVLTSASSTLQAAYVGGNTIDVTAGEGSVFIQNSTDTTDTLSIIRTFAGVGVGMFVDMGPTTTDVGIEIDHEGAGAGLIVDDVGTGTGDGIDVYCSNTTTGVGVFVSHAGSGNGLGVLYSGTGQGINVDYSGTNIGVAVAYSGPTTALNVDQNSATGHGIALLMGDAGSASGTGIRVSYEDAGSSGLGIGIEQAGSGFGLGVTATGSGQGINVTHSGTNIGIAISYSGNTTAQQIDQNSATGHGLGILMGDGGPASGVGLLITYEDAGSSGNSINVSHDGSGAGLVLDNLGTGNAVQIKDSGTNTFVINASGGIAATGLAASSFTTAAGALTITAAVASTWSTTAGVLTLNGAGGIALQGGGTSALTLNNTGTTITVQAGATLTTTSTGNINLPNNGSSKFQIETVAVSANVTAANLGTLTAGPASNADALHTHSGVSASQIVQTGFDTSTNTLGDGDLGYLTTTANRVQKAIATSLAAAVVFGANEGTAGSMTTHGTIENQNVESTITVVAGDRLYVSVSEAGKVTNVAPNTVGQVVAPVGVARTGNGGAGVDVPMLLLIGTPILL